MMLRTRRATSRPQLELLEPRITPSNIGVNLSGNDGTQGDFIWVDVHN